MTGQCGSLKRSLRDGTAGIFAPDPRSEKAFTRLLEAKPTWSDIEISYGTFFVSLATPLIGTISVLAVFATSKGPCPDRAAPRFSLPEVALAIGALAIPIVGVFLAKYVTGAFTKRYAILTVVGLGLMFGYCIRRFTERAVAIGLILAVLGVWALIGSEFRHRRLGSQAAELADAYNFLDCHADPNEQVVIGEQFLFTQVVYYWPQSRFHPLCVVKAELLEGEGDTGRPLLGLGRIVGLDVIEYDDFTRPWRGLLLFAPPKWLLKSLGERGITLEVVAEHFSGTLYRGTLYRLQ